MRSRGRSTHGRVSPSLRGRYSGAASNQTFPSARRTGSPDAPALRRSCSTGPTVVRRETVEDSVAPVFPFIAWLTGPLVMAVKMESVVRLARDEMLRPVVPDEDSGDIKDAGKLVLEPRQARQRVSPPGVPQGGAGGDRAASIDHSIGIRARC